MGLYQILNEALESLNANKMRSGLTILGIVIGVGAVIAMLGIGQGAQNSISGTINGIGTNLLFVFSGNQQIKLRNIRRLTTQDGRFSLIPIKIFRKCKSNCQSNFPGF